MSRKTPTPGFAEWVTAKVEEFREAQTTGAEYPPRDNRTPAELLAEIDSLVAQLAPLPPGAAIGCRCEDLE